MLQEVALEAVEAELAALLELLDGLDFLGDQLQPALLEAPHQGRQLLAGHAARSPV